MPTPKRHTTLLALTVATLLVACGQDSSPIGDAAIAPGPAPGGVTTPVVTTDLPVPTTAPKNRYELANGCFGLQARGSKKFVVTSGPAPAASGNTLAEASGFTMKATALGRYAIFDPQSRWLDAISPADAVANAAANGAATAGENASSAGDVLVLVPPLAPVGSGINQGAGAVGSAGQTAANMATASRTLAMTTRPTRGAEWRVEEVGGDATKGFHLINQATSANLAIGDSGDVFDFVPAQGCAVYPEVQLNARGTPSRGKQADGTVFGYAETHMHLGGSEALGGRVGYGRPFATFGVIEALEDCEADHGPNGANDAVDVASNSVRQSDPPHETKGWPTFRDWPTYSSYTHHQTYYLWIKRAWMSGLRLMMNHLVANEQLCIANPRKQYDCDEMESIKLQRQLAFDVQDYIDAQEGGPGLGFFRIVTTPQEARRVIEDGKMAVILGTENEKIFGCGEYLDSPECTKAQIDAELDRWYGMGLRAIFPIHLFDNALGGSRLTDDAALSALYQAGNTADTGHPYATTSCDQANAVKPGEAPVQQRGDYMQFLVTQASGMPPQPPLTPCLDNARGLTELGDYFVKAMIDRGMMIETDHSGILARKRILDVAAERGVGVLSGHTGFVADSRDSKRILKVGGVISSLPDKPSTKIVDFIQQLATANRELYGNNDKLATGLGCDINGLHKQAAPRDDAAARPLRYPFKSYDGQVTFERQVSGERVFDINVDGVAHYGLYPDLIADMRQQPGGEEAMTYLFRSAEAYLQFWENAQAKRLATGRAP